MHVDLVVVGAGVLGTFHAYHAARRGMSVALLERGAMPNGASVRNFGMVSATIVAPGSEWAAYAQSSIALYHALQAQIDISVRTAGSLYLASTATEATVLREYAERAALPCSFLPAAEVRQRYPFVQPDYSSGGLLFPHDIALDPRRMLAALIPYLVEQHAVKFYPHTTVIAIDEGPTHAVAHAADGRRFTATQIVVCNGADCELLYPELLRASDVQVCKLQMLQTVAQPGFALPHTVLSGLSIRRYPVFAACPSYAAMLAERIEPQLAEYGIHVMFSQAPGGIVFGDSHEYRSLDATGPRAEATTWPINAAIIGYAQRMLRLPSWQLQSLWNGYYLTRPNQPVLAHQVSTHVQIATAIGGKGMTTGPGFAEASVQAMFEAGNQGN